MEQSRLPGNWALLAPGTDLGLTGSPSWLCPPARPRGAAPSSAGQGQAAGTTQDQSTSVYREAAYRAAGLSLPGGTGATLGPGRYHLLLKPFGSSTEDFTEPT